MDGHDKLAPYGIEIYAAIDAYSRYIIWCYVGISNRTEISVLRQLLDSVHEYDKFPRYIRTDRGKETPMCAGAHYQLHRQQTPDIELKDCFLYGPSTANQRIEAWWQQAQMSSLYRWRVRDHF